MRAFFVDCSKKREYVFSKTQKRKNILLYTIRIVYIIL